MLYLCVFEEVSVIFIVILIYGQKGICVARKHRADLRNLEESIKFAYYQAEQGLALMKMGLRKFVVLYDCKDMKPKNVDLGVIKRLKPLLQYYPEMLHRVYIVFSNSAFIIFLKLMRAVLMDKHMQQKLVVISHTDELHKYFEKSSLLIKYGGTSTYKYKFHATQKLRYTLPGDSEDDECSQNMDCAESDDDEEDVDG